MVNSLFRAGVDFVSMPCYAHSFGGLGGPSVQSNAGIGIAFDLRCVTSKSCCSSFAAGASFHFQAFARFFPKGGLFRLSSTQTTQRWTRSSRSPLGC
jgi:hypothetical protein